MKKVLIALSISWGVFIHAQEMVDTDPQVLENEISKQEDDTIYTATSRVDNSGFLQTVGFDGAWKFDMNLERRKITLTGGSIVNKSSKPSNTIRLMVYLADKPFNLDNPDFIGNIYSVIDISALESNDKESGKVYDTSWASEEKLDKGTYYPYILLGEKNPNTGQFEVKDVKAFEKSITIS